MLKITFIGAGSTVFAKNVLRDCMLISALREAEIALFDIDMAAILDPHTSAELSIDEIRSLCDDLIEAHGSWLPQYK